MSLLDRFTRTPASGTVHVWPGPTTGGMGGAGGSGGTGVIGISPLGWTRMAHPTWPYGTVIKPTKMNSIFHEDTRQMVVGRNPGAPFGCLVTIDLRTETPYTHLLEDIEDRWEVEEAP